MLLNSLSKGQAKGGGCGGSGGRSQELRGLSLQCLAHSCCKPVVRCLQKVPGRFLEPRVEQNRTRPILIQRGWQRQLWQHCKKRNNEMMYLGNHSQALHCISRLKLNPKSALNLLCLLLLTQTQMKKRSKMHSQAKTADN